MRYDSILEDPDYLAVLKYAAGDQKMIISERDGSSQILKNNTL